MVARKMVAPGFAVFVLFSLAWAAFPAIASQAEADAISRNIQARHLPWGTILDPVFASSTSNQIVNYTRCGDSAIWTGHYLAAEAYRYKVTGSPVAFTNVQSAIAGIKSLLDVTGTDLLARCRIPLGSPYAPSIILEEQHNGIYSNSAQGYNWVGNTSRDQYSGVFFGLAVAWDMVNDPGIHNSISALVTRMLDFLLAHAWTVVMPNGTISTTFIIRPDQQLTLLQIGRHVNPGKYSTLYDTNLLLSASVLLPISVEVQDNGSYFKFNIDYINFLSLAGLEKSLIPRAAYRAAYAVLRNHTASHENAFFNMIDAALTGLDTARDRDTLNLLEAWLQRPRRDLAVDLRGKLPSCSTDEACTPVPVPQRPNTDFLWQRNPFFLDASGDGTVETAGIDYLLPFWMARYYGIMDASSVVSAATGEPLTAPESIASFYGANLADTPSQATFLPLPFALSGIHLDVIDSTGASRQAPLFYASPGQVNFEIPVGTAAGRATFRISKGGTVVASTTANVQSIAPALFTASGTGSGVAAALSQQGQSVPQPIFQCSASACSFLPIPLDPRIPTYLSLYGTGLRNRSTVGNVKAAIAGVNVPVLYADAQGSEAGLDQVNVSIPAALRGTGVTTLTLVVDGQPANTVLLNIQ